MSTLIRRTRTPPALKWLLNERAALAGAAKSIVARQLRVAEIIQVHERKIEALQDEIAEFGQLLAQKTDAISALDTSINLIHGGVDPAAAGCVNAWQGKYGKRGALKAFLLQALEQAPEPITTTEIINLVIRHFNLTVVLKEDRHRLGQTLARKFHEFRDGGLIEGLHDPLKSSTGIWRWKQPPTIADLAAQVAAHDRTTYPHSP